LIGSQRVVSGHLHDHQPQAVRVSDPHFVESPRFATRLPEHLDPPLDERDRRRRQVADLQPHCGRRARARSRVPGDFKEAAPEDEDGAARELAVDREPQHVTVESRRTLAIPRVEQDAAAQYLHPVLPAFVWGLFWGDHTGCYDRPPCRATAPPAEGEIEGKRVANIKSQLKRIQTNEKARLRNKSIKSSLKTAIRRFREAAAAGEKGRALDELQTASRQLDKAVSKGVIHRNQAANRKSAMAQRANQL
jgi:small subunit ribosomal protein S20